MYIKKKETIEMRGFLVEIINVKDCRNRAKNLNNVGIGKLNDSHFQFLTVFNNYLQLFIVFK